MAAIAATADRPMVVHRPGDRTAATAIRPRHRIAQVPLEEAIVAVPDRTGARAVRTAVARMEASAPARMAVLAGVRTEARVVVLTEAIAKATP
jgi:hypothetical protein